MERSGRMILSASWRISVHRCHSKLACEQTFLFLSLSISISVHCRFGGVFGCEKEWLVMAEPGALEALAQMEKKLREDARVALEELDSYIFAEAENTRRRHVYESALSTLQSSLPAISRSRAEELSKLDKQNTAVLATLAQVESEIQALLVEYQAKQVHMTELKAIMVRDALGLMNTFSLHGAARCLNPIFSRDLSVSPPNACNPMDRLSAMFSGDEVALMLAPMNTVRCQDEGEPTASAEPTTSIVQTATTSLSPQEFCCPREDQEPSRQASIERTLIPTVPHQSPLHQLSQRYGRSAARAVNRQ